MILLTLQMRRVMMRLMASHGLLGPLATVEATMGASDNTMTAPSNTCTKYKDNYPKIYQRTIQFKLPKERIHVV